jgi:AmmeMemoRadiSam system protein B
MHAISEQEAYIRHPAVAGLFYPGDADELGRMVERFLHEAHTDAPAPKAMIVPHAGYVYSGPIAASAYARLRNREHEITRVVLLGPAHRVGFYGVAASSADYFETPLGRIPLDREAIDRVVGRSEVFVFDQAHQQEHSLEVHLPFLQATLGDFKLIPLVVGSGTGEEVVRVIDDLWGGDETLVVVSSDLSHYHDYKTAHDMDTLTTRAIEALEPAKIRPEQACGRLPIQGLLTALRARKMHCTNIDLRNSGDTAGPRDQVVGYGAYVCD